MEEVLSEAAALENEYNWIGAKSLYEQTLNTVKENDFLNRGEIQEKIGYALRRAAFQAESQEEFREKMRQAIKAYESAYEFYEKLDDEQGVPWMLRCNAVSKDLGYWLASDPSEKRRLLDECLILEEKALASFWGVGNKLEYVRTYNLFPLAFYNRHNLEWDLSVRRRIYEKAIAWGEKAVTELSEMADSHEFARANCILNFYLYFFHLLYVADPEEWEQHRLKDIERIQKVVELSERIDDDYLVGLSYWNWGLLARVNGSDDYFHHLNNAMESGEKTRDILLKAIVQDCLTFVTYWEAIATDNPDQRKKLIEESMAFYDKAQLLYSILSYIFRQKAIIVAPGGYVEHYYNLARYETDLGKKLELLEKSEKEGIKALKVAEDSDLPIIINRMCHLLSKTLQARATLEPDFKVKRSLLERAMKLRERNIEIDEQLHPNSYWEIGVWSQYLALIKMEYADIESALKDKRRLLEDATVSMEKCLENIEKVTPFLIIRANFAALMRFQDNYGIILTRLYEVTKEPDYLRRAIRVLYKAVESASKVDLISRIAESYWKIADKYDILGEPLEAAEYFRRASESYVEAARKMPQLEGFYLDYASYMKAWSEIERARHQHQEKKYGRAKEHYENAAELHEATERWSYLSHNYLAWAHVEEAEDLSRNEQTQEARDLFQQAAQLFSEASKSIEAKLKKIQAEEERKIAEELVKASETRREYCQGRMTLEEARILDRQGDHNTSSIRYHEASKKFQGVINKLEQESDRKEILPIVYLCQAWEKMMMAEAQTTPRLHEEAAILFEKARAHAPDQPTSMLAQAHSSFCRALEAGARFQTKRDPTLFSLAKNHIEAATSYYLRAGFQVASDYARATGWLIDAYMYTYNAQTETDPGKKARFFQMAERLLQASVDSFLNAKHTEKSEEVRRILDGVKEDREIALSLMEVLHAPEMASTTTSFSTPTPSYEQAVGLERFENADIQANFILNKRDAEVGEDVDVEIALVNAGKAPAQLVKIEEIIPEGFEVKKGPIICRVEDNYLDMRGRTLPPLRTEELKLVLKPLKKGTFYLRPRVFYLDESGKYKLHETEPVTMEVRERMLGPPI